MPVSERQQRERQARIQLILKAALCTFARRGYHGTSMDLIAEEAELGKATLYYYFKSKNELLIALLKEGMESFFARLEESWRNVACPLEKIRLVTEIGAEFFSENPDYFRLYSYMMSHPTLRRRAMENLHATTMKKLNHVRGLFEKAQRLGLIKPIPAEELVTIFGSLVMGMGLFMHAHRGAIDLRRHAQIINEIFLEGILNPQRSGAGHSGGTGQRSERAPMKV